MLGTQKFGVSYSKNAEVVRSCLYTRGHHTKFVCSSESLHERLQYSSGNLPTVLPCAQLRSMKGLFGFAGLLIVLCVGFYFYFKESTSFGPAGTPTNPRAAIDITGVQNDLVAIASAERRRYASDSHYVSLDDLISNGDVSMRTKQRGPYQYSSDVSDNSFRITATYNGEPVEGAPRTIWIDESMQLRRE